MTDFRTELSRSFARMGAGARLVLDELYADGEAGVIPQLNYRTGRYNRIGEYAPNQWPGFPWVGFLMGRLWMLHDVTGEAYFADHAFGLARKIGPYLASHPLPYADAGLDIYYGLCLGHELTGDGQLRDWALAAVPNLTASYRPEFRAIFQHGGDTTTYIDMPFAFQGAYWAARFRPELAEPVVACNETFLACGILRPDGSTYHAVEFDPATGRPTRLITRQGSGDESTWTRGQAWAIHNFTNAYEATGDERFLSTAIRLTDWYLAHIPDDHVPFYDFDDPDRDAIPRDSCSAAITSNAMVRLSRHLPDVAARYRPRIEATLGELMRNYLTSSGVLLHGSWGRVRKTHGIGAFPQQDIMPYGNYWIMESIYRLIQPDWRIFRTTGAVAS